MEAIKELSPEFNKIKKKITKEPNVFNVIGQLAMVRYL